MSMLARLPLLLRIAKIIAMSGDNQLAIYTWFLSQSIGHRVSRVQFLRNVLAANLDLAFILACGGEVIGKLHP
jgi:hypothetical protein